MHKLSINVANYRSFFLKDHTNHDVELVLVSPWKLNSSLLSVIFCINIP